MRFNELTSEGIDPGAKAAIKGMRELSSDQYYGLYKTMKDVAGHDGKKQTAPEGKTDHEVSDKPFAYAYTEEEKNMIKGVDPKAKQITSDKSEEVKEGSEEDYKKQRMWDQHNDDTEDLGIIGQGEHWAGIHRNKQRRLDKEQQKKGVAEGQGDFATALSKLSGSWSGWHKEEDMSSPDIDVYEYDDGEGGYYGRGTIEHNLKSGEVKVKYHDSENDADVDGTFKNMGDAMRALRGQWGQNHGGQAPNFDRLGQRKQHGPDDLRKTDRTGRKGTLAGGPTNSLKQAIQWNKGKHGPVGKLPESIEEGDLYATALQRYPQLKQVNRETVINALNGAYEDYLMHYGYEGIGPDEESSMIDHAVKRLKQGVAEAGGKYDHRDPEHHELDAPRPLIYGLKINGKIWKKDGNTVTFFTKERALAAKKSMLNKKPELEITLVQRPQD